MRDLHREKAAELFGVPQSAVTPAQRFVGKEANFARLYGGKLFPFHEELLEQSKQMTLKTWPGVAKLTERGIVTDETSIVVNGHIKGTIDAFNRAFNIQGTETGRSEC